MIFNEKRIRIKRQFQLDGGVLKIKGKNGFSYRFETEFDLSVISLVPSKIWVRSPELGIWFVVFPFILLTAISLILSTQEYLIIIPIVIILLIAIGYYIIKEIKPIEFASFEYKTGNFAFDIAKAGPDKNEFQGFVDAICSSIKKKKIKN